MHKGTITCSCGRVFYFETLNEIVRCINCDKEYDVFEYEEKEEEDEQEGE